MTRTCLCISVLILLLLCFVLPACTWNTSGPDGIDPSLTGESDGDTFPNTLVPENTNALTEPITVAVTDLTAESGTQPADTEPATELDYFEANRIELVKPDESKVPDMAVTDKGYDIYRLTEGREWGYRYGCTYLYNEDGSIDAYFACVGTISGEWDWIAYRHSPDGGETWEEEKIVLTPTQGSMDHFSNCDPGVVYFDGYYYLGYTSTLNSSGFCNNLFVARSKNPDGPFEKWNGSGWGGTEPQPIVYFDENWEKWGIGEPAFVELNGTLYMYYTHSGAAGEYTMVATADATNENWPATLEFHGAACKKNTDSLDVKYVEEWGKFIAVATGDRMGLQSWLGVYESNDGIRFELVDITREGTYSHLHNAGISSRPNGHIRITEDADKLRVIYAYGEGWGTWNTRIQPISLTLSNGNDLVVERAKPCLSDEHLRDELIPEADRHVAMIRPAKDVYTYAVDKGDFIIQLFTFDTYFTREPLPRSEYNAVEFVIYDESVIQVGDNLRTNIVGVGMTPVEVRYKGCVYLFHVIITEQPIHTGNGKTPVNLEPAVDNYTLYFGERSLHKIQLRTRMWWDNGTFTELYCDKSDAVVTYTGYDPRIISVSDQGIVTMKQVGETTVTVTCMGQSCQITIKITDTFEDGYYRLADHVEYDYKNLDFTAPGAEKILGGMHSVQLEHDAEVGALKATVTGGDAQFLIPFNMAADTVTADAYKTIEITYMAPKDNSPAAASIQFFLCAGSVTAPNASYQVMRRLTSDGEFHTLTVDLSALSYWTGDIHILRIDFFDQSTVGDVMYIRSIKLLP